MSELRRDPIGGRWVIVADGGHKGPSDFDIGPEQAGEPKNCPFCQGNERMTPPELLVTREPAGAPNSPGWSMRVVSNKFPALKIEGGIDRQSDGIFEMSNGIGAHEVIIETPDHTKELSELPLEQIESVIGAYCSRSLDLRRDSRFRYILIFKNHGQAAGASLSHSHTQLIALPMVPKTVHEEITAAGKYFSFKERCIYCDIARQEKADKERLVCENDTYLAFCPFASRFAFEMWVVPKQHFAAFDYINPQMAKDLAAILKCVLGRMAAVLKAPPYNFIIHTSPIEEKIREEYHWHLEIMPKLTRTAGFEWGTGFYINPTPPELAAKYLRGGNKNGNKSRD